MFTPVIVGIIHYCHHMFHYATLLTSYKWLGMLQQRKIAGFLDKLRNRKDKPEGIITMFGEFTLSIPVEMMVNLSVSLHLPCQLQSSMDVLAQQLNPKPRPIPQ